MACRAAGIRIRPIEDIEQRITQIAAHEQVNAPPAMIFFVAGDLPLILEERDCDFWRQRRAHAGATATWRQAVAGGEHCVAQRFTVEPHPPAPP